jgi:hypothetical protein
MIVQQLIWIVLILAIILLSVLAFIVISIKSRKKNAKRNTKVKTLLFGVIGRQLKSPEHQVPTTVMLVLKKAIRSKKGLWRVCEQMAQIHQLVQLPDKQQPLAILFTLGIDKRIAANLKSSNWFYKAKAIQMSYELHLSQHFKSIKNDINHDHILVRREAQVATIVFMGWKGIQFLPTITHPISLWQQLRILEKLRAFPIPSKTGSLEKSLQSNNQDVVCLAIRCAMQLNLSSLSNSIAALKNHNSPIVKQLATSFLELIIEDNGLQFISPEIASKSKTKSNGPS